MTDTDLATAIARVKVTIGDAVNIGTGRSVFSIEELRLVIAAAEATQGLREAADAVSEWFCTEARQFEGARINALRMAMVAYDTALKGAQS